MEEDKRKDLHQWMNEDGPQSDHSENDDDQRMKSFLGKVSDLDVPAKRSKSEIWDSIENNIEAQEMKESTRRIPSQAWMAIAASLALIITTWYLFMYNPLETIENERGIAQFMLPDGTEIILNAESSISYQPKNWSENRVVQLYGEAFFEVVKGSKFEVNTEQGKVTVLGTSFNVFSRNTDFEVACKTGKVRVESNEGKVSQDLSPGEKLIFADNKMSYLKVDQMETIGSWQTGNFYFNGAKLSQVLDEIERQFNLKIVRPDLGGRTYTGYFTNDNLDQVLEIVLKPMGLEYEFQKENTLIIR